MVCSSVGSFAGDSAFAAIPTSSIAGLITVISSILTSRIEDNLSYERGKREILSIYNVSPDVAAALYDYSFSLSIENSYAAQDLKSYIQISTLLI